MSLNSQLSSACHRSTRLLPYLKPSVAPTASKREPILLHSPAVTSSPDSSWTPGSLLHTLRPHELPPPSIPQWAPSGLRALVPEAAQPQISPTASSSSPATHPVSPTASKRPCLPMPLKGVPRLALPSHHRPCGAHLLSGFTYCSAGKAGQRPGLAHHCFHPSS